MTLVARSPNSRWEKRVLADERADIPHASARQLLLDVSHIARHDARTGIQRVVRAIASALQRQSLPDVRVKLVAADRTFFYRYLPDDWLQKQEPDRVLSLGDLDAVTVEKGDIFFGLDFCASILREHEDRLADWRAQGVELNIVLYDLLPVTHGHWFTFKMRRNFRKWLKLVERHADRVVAISDSVAEQFAARQKLDRDSRPLQIVTARLGSDISASLPSWGLPPDSGAVLDWLESHPTILMVGTVEPRKGYEQVVAAFEHLWKHQPNPPQLLIIGRGGWKTDKLQRTMRRASGHGQFLWLDQASDEYLEQIYSRATGLLVASEGEGFGLPIVEGLSHGLPVLARDLPVFRELQGSGVSFFSSSTPAELASAVSRWISSSADGKVRIVRATTSWDDTASALAAAIIPTGVNAASLRTIAETAEPGTSAERSQPEMRVGSVLRKEARR